MIIFVSGATKTWRKYWDESRFGYFITPRVGSASKTHDKIWAADNDAFQGWTAERNVAFSKMIGRLALRANKTTCKFIACPDVVGDAKATLEMFSRHSPTIRCVDFPVAFVAQDGIHSIDVPWADFECLFIGGTTEFKLSQEVDALIETAKQKNKWVHVGRVNTLKRIRHFFDVSVDSIDGTAFSKFPDVFFERGVRWLKRLERQRTLCFGD